MATPWINFREMKEISSKQNKYSEWTYQTKIDHESPLEPTYNGDSNAFDEIGDISILAEESTLTDHVISNEELPILTDTIIEEEHEHHPNFEHFREDASLAEQLASNEELPIDKETNVAQEKDHPLAISESHTEVILTEQLANHEEQFIYIDDHLQANDGSLPEELTITEQLIIHEEQPLFTETNSEEEYDHPSHIEKCLPEEPTISEQLTSNEGLHIPIEPIVEENNEQFQHIDADHVEDLIKDQIASNQELASPTESNDTEENDYLPNSNENVSEEQGLTTQADSNLKFPNKALSEVEHNIHIDDIEKLKSNNPPDLDKASPTSKQGEVYTTTKKSPFSTFVEITDFLHAPIYGENVQQFTFEFLDLQDELTPQLETKLFHTIRDYPEQPNYRLVRSNINQMISLIRTDKNDKKNKYRHPCKSGVVPLHNSQTIHKGETNSYSSDSFIHIRVPVVLGEYKIEICMEEYIAFDKGIKEVKEITNEVLLSDCRFVPIYKSQTSDNGTCTVLKGNLFIEGYIQHNIEYTVSNKPNETDIHPNQLCQNIVLELVIHMLQVQKIKVLFDGEGFGGL
ncbi:hypothetical protein U1P98_10330 [Lysinibacillus irui]|uniref:DUF7852 domain-containing protein n=1 Tax=Lysinibacillus irui TaxID=2998077 RepID=A0ABU5NKX5_9BACI|nr:hypothetical protein [Lysinibacillus irui]MEA0554975.1 hypothetical protein [Lysinibacillus irui]MEA0976690.1 hypothetical protein [Lysinibacillus irui]MEA1042844.1 hypothetical protein [Lysinibacillus irui]